jgi:pimeloyl-ACP methyl ester carboxylesterase
MYLDPDVLAAPPPPQPMHHKAAEDARRVAGLGRGFGFQDQIPLGPPTVLGVVGHSWGARAAARVAVRGTVEVTAITSISGSWDENAAIGAFIDAAKPTLMIAGTEDFLNASYLQALWSALAIPKHQAMLQGIGHWDWFGHPGSIHPCNPSAPRPACPVAWQTASELVLAFMTKYLLNHWWRPPYLLGSPGGRPPFLNWYDTNGPCALKVRWNDPTASGAQGQIGEITLGHWTAPSTW